jgi:hypothetical protein
MGRLISVILVAVYLVFSFSISGAVPVKMVVFLPLSLACIWFGDEMGANLGRSVYGGPNITQQLPGSITRFVGWILLLVSLIIGISSSLT